MMNINFEKECYRFVNEDFAKYRADGDVTHLIDLADVLLDVGSEAWPALKYILDKSPPELEYFVYAILIVAKHYAHTLDDTVLTLSKSKDPNVLRRLAEVLYEINRSGYTGGACVQAESCYQELRYINARLLAKAPDLLQALEQVLELQRLNKNYNQHFLDRETELKFTQLIQEAKGEELTTVTSYPGDAG